MEELTRQIEQGEIGLEESITKYEEGMKLVQHCRDVLGKAEHKIEQLQQRADGSLAARGVKGGAEEKS